ncbi:MAG TPA: helix-turn-helix domain-containing protein [Tepidisphaeraceae bacterium]|nr:helix-turn-helix domain-containing protein [Tepidisphaeraceae bacterium]
MLRTPTLGSVPDAYLDLVMKFPLRRIKTAQHHRAAIAVFTRLASRKKDAPTLAYAEALVTLIGDYERRAGFEFDTSQITAEDMVRQWLEEHGMSVNALAQKTGIAQSALSQMLRGKRGWSKSAIIKLSKFLKIDPGIFFR